LTEVWFLESFGPREDSGAPQVPSSASPQTLEDPGELSTAIHDYIELFHNTRRRHSALGMLTPTEYEDLHATQQAA
jgi:hypothetical protein